MKKEVGLLFLILSFGLLAVMVTSDVIEQGLPVTIIIGNVNSSGGSTTQNITLDHPGNINFDVYARDKIGQSKNVTVTIYDHDADAALNTSQFIGLGHLYSPSTYIDFDMTYDSGKLDTTIQGLDITGLNSTQSVIYLENSNPQISNFTLYRAYRVELPTGLNYTNIVLKIKLSDVVGVNYANLTVLTCSNYNSVTNICTDQNGWVAPNTTVTADSGNQQVSLNINHFSVYAVGSSGSPNANPTTTTTSTTSSTTSTTSTSTSSTSTTSTSSVPSGSTGGSTGGSSGGSTGGSGGGGGGGLSSAHQTTSTTSTSSTSEIPSSTESSTTTQENQTLTNTTQEKAPISGFFGLSNQLMPLIIIPVAAAITVVAFYLYKTKYDVAGSGFSSRSFKSAVRYGNKNKKRRNSTELTLSL